MRNFETEDVFGKYSDCIVISASDHVFKFSIAVLYSRTDYFKKLFSTRMIESQTHTLHMSHSPTTVNFILNISLPQMAASEYIHSKSFNAIEILDIIDAVEEYQFDDTIKQVLDDHMCTETIFAESMTSTDIMNKLFIYDFMKKYKRKVSTWLIGSPRYIINSMDVSKICFTMLSDVGVDFYALCCIVPSLVDLGYLSQVEEILPQSFDEKYSVNEPYMRALHIIYSRTTIVEIKNKISDFMVESHMKNLSNSC